MNGTPNRLRILGARKDHPFLLALGARSQLQSTEALRIALLCLSMQALGYDIQTRWCSMATTASCLSGWLHTGS